MDVDGFHSDLIYETISTIFWGSERNPGHFDWKIILLAFRVNNLCHIVSFQCLTLEANKMFISAEILGITMALSYP